MSFIQIKKGVPDFNKMTMELWFRIPKEMMRAAAKEAPIDGDGPLIMRRIISLKMYSEMLEKPFPAPQTAVVSNGTPGDGAPAWTALTGFTDGALTEYDPCYIGVDCGPRGDLSETVNDILTKGARLVFNIQTSAHATGSGLYADVTDVDNHLMLGDEFIEPFPPEYNDASGDGSGKYVFSGFDTITDPDNPIFRRGYGTATGYTDSTSSYLSRTPECFYVEVLERIKPDKWYHLIFSHDISATIISKTPAPTGYLEHEVMWKNVAAGVTGYGKMWYALNDVDYRGRGPNKPPDANGRVFPTYHLGPYSVDYINLEKINPFASTPPTGLGSAAPGDPNGILTKTAFDVASQPAPTFNIDWNLPAKPRPSVTVTPGLIKAKGTPLGLPAIEDYVDHIYQVEMARFRVWYGDTFDTKKEDRRRIFITDEGKPAPLKLAVEYFGRDPDVSLERKTDWINGINKGSLGYTVDGDKDPAGQFDVNGVPSNPDASELIKRFMPEPSLRGPQSKP